MLSCELCRAFLDEMVPGEKVPEPLSDAIEAHLRSCGECRAYAESLRWVEEAVSTYPLMPAPASLQEQVMATITENPQQDTRWRWLQWDIWLPAVAFVLALAIVVLSLDAPTNPIAREGGRVSSLDWIEDLHKLWAQIIRGPDGGSPWLVWTGISAILALLGIRMGLSAWQQAGEDAHQQLHAQLGNISNWLDGLITRT